jgi:hypothetical protein
MIDPFSGLPCVVGEICGIPRMTFHGNIIAHGHYNVGVTMINRRSTLCHFQTHMLQRWMTWGMALSYGVRKT